jgi:glyoxylase-like metal-dependent hydrolase (beta-lactamase superfamily II)
MVSLNDLADRPPRHLADGDVIDLGGKRVRQIDTPHVPHAWEARILY